MMTIEALIETQIVRISLDKVNANVEIELLSSDKQKHWRLVASGVDEFLMDDVGLYNIVDDIVIYNADDVDDKNFIAQIYYLMRKKEISQGDVQSPFIKEKIKLIKNNTLRFWVINPIYGGFVFILAKEIFIYENGRDY